MYVSTNLNTFLHQSMNIDIHEFISIHIMYKYILLLFVYILYVAYLFYKDNNVIMIINILFLYIKTFFVEI